MFLPQVHWVSLVCCLRTRSEALYSTSCWSSRLAGQRFKARTQLAASKCQCGSIQYDQKWLCVSVPLKSMDYVLKCVFETKTNLILLKKYTQNKPEFI